MSTRYCETWFNHGKRLLYSCGLDDVLFLDNQHIATSHIVDSVKMYLRDEHKQSWLDNMQQMPKLRTYKHFKSEFGTET